MFALQFFKSFRVWLLFMRGYFCLHDLTFSGPPGFQSSNTLSIFLIFKNTPIHNPFAQRKGFRKLKLVYFYLQLRSSRRPWSFRRNQLSKPDLTAKPNWPKSWQAYACWLGCFFLMFNSWGLVIGMEPSHLITWAILLKGKINCSWILSVRPSLVTGLGMACFFVTSSQGKAHLFK